MDGWLFPYMPVSRSKSPSSCIIFTLLQNLSIIHDYAMFCFQLQRTPVIRYFAVIRANRKLSNHAFFVLGPREWDSLQTSVLQSTLVAQLKSKLKTHLFSLYYN